MIDNKILKLTEIIVGIRHKRNFTVLDNFGNIIDNIIDNSKFPDGYFSEVSTDGFTKIISNSNSKNYIKLTQFDLIYRHKIGETSNLEQEFEIFLDRIISQLVPLIIEKYEVREFSRIGIVFGFEFLNRDTYKNYLKNVINSNFSSNINSIRFSEKIMTNESRLFKGTNDYMNKLYSLAINDKDTPIFSYDFQYYFNPIKSVFKQCEFEKIFNNAQKSLQNDIIKITGEDDEAKTQ